MAAHFFCENCGAEVKRDSKNCPKCGRSFASILCPACGFVGEEALFAGGCPVCGYTAPAQGAPKNHPGKTLPQKFSAGALPGWAYALAVLVFAAVAALLLFSQ
ncbi:conserved hypothetical protein [Treponema primitia ZAS-2]|uniref:DZANK-type domain-containing protein n=1 Tax=Treponema primitia (strain ATCC BAA-887 / DSM 12427 / ZAS-2) TaxID=545694 RepID=F5YGQ1_TREPZ|nr:zinc ribbon domain-containing protein [Treponema primitia]AEF85727.1 conserved hypothetical protein [Treponema primitia ZAS-2]